MPYFLIGRLVEAFTNWGTVADWRNAAFFLLLIALTALHIGFRCSFFTVEKSSVSRRQAACIALGSFVAPSLAKEVVFRVLLLPRDVHALPSALQLLWGAASVVAFVMYHPLKAWPLPGRGRFVFTAPAFLALTAVIGTACATSYIRSGSVWPPVVIHGVCVAVWLLYLGGWRRMNR